MTTIQRIHPDDVRVVPEWQLCDRLARSLRLIPFLTQAEIGEFLGVRQETVGRWLLGKNRPSHAVLMVWADMTGVDLEWLETGQTPTSSTSGPVAALPRLDSNQQPSGYRFALVEGVRPDLTVNRIPGNPRPRPSTTTRPGHLRAVS